MIYVANCLSVYIHGNEVLVLSATIPPTLFKLSSKISQTAIILCILPGSKLCWIQWCIHLSKRTQGCTLQPHGYTHCIRKQNWWFTLSFNHIVYIALYSPGHHQLGSMSAKPKLTYLNGRGRMESIRWLLAAAGVEVCCLFLGVGKSSCRTTSK